MGERKRGRDRTSQSKLSWSLTITSHTFPLPPQCESLSLLLFCSSLSCSRRVFCPVSLTSLSCFCFFFYFFFISPHAPAAPFRAPDQRVVLHLVALQPIRAEEPELTECVRQEVVREPYHHLKVGFCLFRVTMVTLLL